MRVALYARVSTRQHGQDVETQLQALRAWARQKKYRALIEYADRGWSGAKESRPELDRLMRDCRKGLIEVVVVARFDRFARSVRHLISALEEFRGLGVDFVSLNESVDTRTPAGKMMFTIIAAFAEFERSVIAERVRMGLARARSQGRRLGRPRKRGLDEAAIAEQVRGGCSIKATARQWNIARSTVRAILRRNEEAQSGRTRRASQGSRRRDQHAPRNSQP